MQDLLDVMNGEVPLEVIDEIGTDNYSLKDNSTLNMSDDYAKDLNCAIPVYGSRTKHLSGDSKKTISSPKVNLAETIEETCTVILHCNSHLFSMINLFNFSINSRHKMFFKVKWVYDNYWPSYTNKIC
jgi:hypothetical protein